MKLATCLILCLAAAVFAGELKWTKDFDPGECPTKAEKGQQLSMHYTGSIDESSATGEKGKKFDSSLDRGDPFSFVLGTGQVIKGWDEGLLGICVGEKRTLIVPPEMGYGENGAGDDIPGGATLKFTVECLSIEEAPPQPNIFGDIDTKHGNGDGKLEKEEIDAWFKKENNMDTPAELWDSEDKDKDGFVTWDEFSGPKGDKPEPKDDL